MDLLDYIKRNGDVENAPHGMHAVVEATGDTPPGVIFVLKNINANVNINSQNRLHPFYDRTAAGQTAALNGESIETERNVKRL